ncbi:MAG TPA: hypothetical protein VHY76_01570 [Acetobacteraceae bacterium]|jgi:hypothetical protein|nr:hypothetical protein [Acetobacteraceae bacterium]
MRKSPSAVLLAPLFAVPLFVAPLVASPATAHADALREWQMNGKSLADLVGAGMTVFSITTTKVNNGMQRIFWLRGTLDGRSTLAQCGEDFVGIPGPAGEVTFSMTDVGCGTLAEPERVK